MGLREERGQDDGQQLEMSPPDSVVARLGTLGREQQLGEKPPWLYVREEENTQLLFQWTVLPEQDKELGGMVVVGNLFSSVRGEVRDSVCNYVRVLVKNMFFSSEWEVGVVSIFCL